MSRASAPELLSVCILFFGCHYYLCLCAIGWSFSLFFLQTGVQYYKKDHLPGGCYYNPDPETVMVLSALKPHNDAAESVFGYNDWLSRVLPNMAQSTHSALVEASYNKTIEWLKCHEKKEKIIKLAQSHRNVVSQQSKEEKKRILESKFEKHK